MSAPKLSPFSTKHRYFLWYRRPRRPVLELTTSDFRDAVRKIELRGAPEIAWRVPTTCGQIMRYAIAHDLIERNPVADVRPAATQEAALCARH